MKAKSQYTQHLERVRVEHAAELIEYAEINGLIDVGDVFGCRSKLGYLLIYDILGFFINGYSSHYAYNSKYAKGHAMVAYLLHGTIRTYPLMKFLHNDAGTKHVYRQLIYRPYGVQLNV